MRKTLMDRLFINEGIEEPPKSFLDFRVCKWLLMPLSGKQRLCVLLNISVQIVQHRSSLSLMSDMSAGM